MSDTPAARAFITISTAPNSTAETAQLLRMLGNATGDPALGHAADRLAGGVRRSSRQIDDLKAVAPAALGAHGPMCERTFISIARDILKRGPAPDEISKAFAAAGYRPAWAVRTLEDRQACYEIMMADVAALEAKGKARQAIGMVVANYADRRNPLEKETISRHLRKLRKKADQSVSGPKIPVRSPT
jgi:hypothetical protein